jgi:hypothetical protein
MSRKRPGPRHRADHPAHGDRIGRLVRSSSRSSSASSMPSTATTGSMPWSIRCGSAIGALLIAGLHFPLRARHCPSAAQAFAGAGVHLGGECPAGRRHRPHAGRAGVSDPVRDGGSAGAIRRAANTALHGNLPEGLWLLAIVLFVIVGASLPWQDFTWITGLQALALLLVRGQRPSSARWRLPAAACPCPSACWSPPASSRCRRQPSSWLMKSPACIRKSAVRPSPCRSFAAAIMELAGPALCRLALRKSGEMENSGRSQRRYRMTYQSIGRIQGQRAAFSLGVELELQLVSKRDFDLTRAPPTCSAASITTNVSARSSWKSPKA